MKFCRYISNGRKRIVGVWCRKLVLLGVFFWERGSGMEAIEVIAAVHQV